MRTDMFKVIVERPRGYKGTDARANRRRDDFDGPQFLGMRAGYGYRELNENLRPLQRYLRSQVGRPWNKVYSEVARTIDRRNTVQQHVYQHIEDFVAIKVAWKDGRLVDLDAYAGIDELSQELYVDPRTGLLRLNKHYRTWTQKRRERAAEDQAEVDARQRIIDDVTQLQLIDGEWYEIRFTPLPTGAWINVVEHGYTVRKYIAPARFDIVRKRLVSAGERDAVRARHCGVVPIYASAKRQLSHREKKSYGLL
jgi:hypothetical protein